MNRLILVGNGFDLAHGLKTSYNDFMLWYITNCFVNAFDNNIYEDQLIKIEKVTWAESQWQTARSVRDSVRKCYYDNKLHDLITNKWFVAGEDTFNHPNPIEVTKPAKLLVELLKNCSNSKWVNIEAEFYGQLKKTLNPHINDDKREEFLKELNESLKFIINQLEIYLLSLPQPGYIPGYMEILNSPILKKDIYNSILDKEEEPISTCILNFNYTDTFSQYLEYFPQNSSRPNPFLNFIHGQIKRKNNPLIFGFGDELDEHYLKMEKETIKGYFDYIKSFWYFRTSNYRNLVTFIESDEFQIYILGHSCGLSDRTMLNMVFEHPNCKSIKIYYHGTPERNNYVSLTHEIARHFKDKVEMRKRIVSLDKSNPMPQFV